MISDNVKQFYLDYAEPFDEIEALYNVKIYEYFNNIAPAELKTLNNIKDEIKDNNIQCPNGKKINQQTIQKMIYNFSQLIDLNSKLWYTRGQAMNAILDWSNVVVNSDVASTYMVQNKDYYSKRYRLKRKYIQADNIFSSLYNKLVSFLEERTRKNQLALAKIYEQVDNRIKNDCNEFRAIIEKFIALIDKQSDKAIHETRELQVKDTAEGKIAQSIVKRFEDMKELLLRMKKHLLVLTN